MGCAVTLYRMSRGKSPIQEAYSRIAQSQIDTIEEHVNYSNQSVVGSSKQVT